MRAWFVALALICAGPMAMAQTTPLAAPSPEGAIRVAASQDGEMVHAPVGSAIALELQATASTGTSWSVAQKPDNLGEPTQLSGPTSQNAGGRPLLGAPRWQVFVFDVSAAGGGPLVLEKKGRDGAVVETFTINVMAH
ncbi:hypothetical protein U91I_00160 [alpha proteobacterium U9-1i]|nr:hypothetical protein U91I_00160 [alpha proteobacterium U9-1i]